MSIETERAEWEKKHPDGDYDEYIDAQVNQQLDEQ